MRSRAPGPLALGLLGFGLAVAFWLPHLFGLPHLGEPGLWSETELPLLDRARAAAGAAVQGMERAPPVPDWLRAASLAVFGRLFGDAGFGDAGALRLPHTLASAALVGLAIGWMRVRGHRAGLCATAGALAASFPMTSLGASTALGNPIGELLSAVAVLGGLAGLHARAAPQRAVGALLSAAGIGIGIASSGLLLGAALPFTVLAGLAPRRRARARALLGAAALVTLGVVVGLSLRQGDGYIPLLGAAKDLDLLEQPQARRFAAGLEDFGYQVFPWAGLVLMGATVRERGPADRAPALWMLCAVTITAGWSLRYGPTPIPLTIPAAVCGSLAVGRFLDAGSDGAPRRICMLLIAASAVLLKKDATLVPARMVAPSALGDHEPTFPAEALEADRHLGTMGNLALAAVLVGGLLGRRRDRTRLERFAARVPARARDAAVVAAFAAAAAGSAWIHAHLLLTRTTELLSPKRPLDRYARWARAGQLPTPLGVYRVQDPGIAHYSPSAIARLENRSDLTAWFQTDEPAAALVLDKDLAAAYQTSRETGRALYVLDDSHAQQRLIANRLPPGAIDHNPLPGIVTDAPVSLRNPTRLRFEDYIEVVGWELKGPILRGQRHTLRLAIRVLRPLPPGSKLYARLVQGRLSRIGRDPHELTGGRYPCHLWRAGDSILHRWEFNAPPLEILPGEHDLLLGLRRGAKKNYTISEPQGKTGEYGVVVRGTKREFAKVGTVPVW